MKTAYAVIGFLLYCAIAGCLCMAAISNPNLNDTEQWVWCAVAIAWGPAIVLVAAMLSA